MAPPLVIFGAGAFAMAARHILEIDGRRIAGFTVDGQFVQGAEHDGLPLAAFEDLEQAFPPGGYALFFGIGPQQMNQLRMQRFLDARRRGYAVPAYVSGRAITWPNLAVAEGAAVYEGAVVQPFARIAENAVIRPGVQVGHHVVVGAHSFVASGTAIGGSTTIGERCFVGLNATIRDNVRIADDCFIAAGAVVVADAEAGGVYAGHPARRWAKLPEDMT